MPDKADWPKWPIDWALIKLHIWQLNNIIESLHHLMVHQHIQCHHQWYDLFWFLCRRHHTLSFRMLSLLRDHQLFQVHHLVIELFGVLDRLDPILWSRIHDVFVLKGLFHWIVLLVHQHHLFLFILLPFYVILYFTFKHRRRFSSYYMIYT